MAVRGASRHASVNNMNIDSDHDELLPEYDLDELLKDAAVGRYAERFAHGTNLVLIEPDIWEAFPDAESVNAALRLVIEAARLARTEQSA